MTDLLREEKATGVCWFVGAIYDGNADQMPRFIEEGTWENGYEDKYLDLVKSIKAGDRIAIKAAYVRKNNLPFDSRDLHVSTMKIKATGTVTNNYGDGRKISVEWTEIDPPREWFFYTSRQTIWRVMPHDWCAKGLINFTFNGEEQDLDQFRNAPYWRERWGDKPDEKHRFQWTAFYSEIANKLLEFKENREALVQGFHEIAGRVEGLSIYQNDQFEDGTKGPMKDICPFTLMGSFNRGVNESTRKSIAKELAGFLGVTEPLPESFEGIPILNNQRSWLFDYEKNRKRDSIDKLWNIFSEGLRLADLEGDVEEGNRASFVKAYNEVNKVKGVGWNLTMGLYWIRAWDYPTLESQTQQYIDKKLGLQIERNGPKGRCTADDDLSFKDSIEERFREEAYPVHSFPELSLAAWQYKPADETEGRGGSQWKSYIYTLICKFCADKNTVEFSRQEFLKENFEKIRKAFPDNNTVSNSLDGTTQKLRDEGKIEFLKRGHYRLLEFDPDDPEFQIDEIDFEPEAEISTAPVESYSIDDILSDGCFMGRALLEGLIERLRVKKNLVLQGPPGTGKTWLAKRLAYALMGQKDENKLRVVQFHPNLSYEDFVRGWRPTGEGKLELVDGPFMEMVSIAKKEPSVKFVFVIEEVNRGNPAQIFGELLTLLEADKRTPAESIELCYRKAPGERVFVPDNLFVIGTMNIADRSLALVDLALRRRFAFAGLEPTLGNVWREWVNKKFQIDTEILLDIENRVVQLNKIITEDPSLGRQFCIGHSYVTPPLGVKISDPRVWFRQVVETEIGPLLDEYWFDSLDKAQDSRKRLLEDF
jgi:5-methylcytosine-specific restriction enzyme B